MASRERPQSSTGNWFYWFKVLLVLNCPKGGESDGVLGSEEQVQCVEQHGPWW